MGLNALIVIIIESRFLIWYRKRCYYEKNEVFLITGLLCLLYANVITAHAKESANDLVFPQYEPQCGTYATHDMRANGFGNLKKINDDGTTEFVFKLGTCFQCSRCYLICVTQNHPNTMSIGYYAFHSMKEPDIASSTTVTTKDIYYTSAYTISGMTFSYYN